MATVKLNTYIREQICKDILIHRFRKQVDDLIERQAKFAMRVYETAFSKKMRADMDALPKGWLPEDDDVNAQFGDGSRYTSLYFSGRLGIDGPLQTAASPRPEERTYRRFPYSQQRSCHLKLEATHALSQEAQAFENERKDLMETAKSAKKQIEVALQSATTVNALINKWPEIEQFARKYDVEPAPVPALPFRELNGLLDLPPEPEKEAA